jgi:hypothetical protein
MSFSNTAEAIRYTMNTNLSSADASFIGEGPFDLAGFPLAGVGDVNGDGYDDILIGANYNSEGGKLRAGQVYLIFGRPSNWSSGINLKDADASFVGENAEDWAGTDIAGAGDVNNDSYDDILISSWRCDDGGKDKGQTYLIFGKPSGWSMDINLKDSDASFIGEFEGDCSGDGIAGVGDVNADGYDDFLIGSAGNSDFGFWSGQTYLIFGKANGWSNDTNLSKADASFYGERAGSNLGFSLNGVGDVNGDGIDDMLIGAPYDDDVGLNAGQAYLIFGKTSGWSMYTSISTADASFRGENGTDVCAWEVAGAGDVNADGFDDILISANGSDAGDFDTGQVYLIFGKDSGWLMDTPISSANGSFIGENVDDQVGYSIAGAGDVNRDGFDDILIGTRFNDSGGNKSGQAYLILGRSSGWGKHVNISNANASFIGEAAGDEASYPVVGAGDVNGDGYDDILLGAHMNIGLGNLEGKAYLIFPEKNFNPNTITSVKVYSDAGYSDEIDFAEVNDVCYVELIGDVGNSTRMDLAMVDVTSTSSIPGFRLKLIETGASSGQYRGSFKISNKTHGRLRLIEAKLEDIITISSVDDPTKNTTLLVSTPIQLRPIFDNTTAVEDEVYEQTYWSFGYNPVTSWMCRKNASWLSWDPVSHTISGTPDNDHIGTSWVRINISDGSGNSDEHNFTLQVLNTPPKILNDNLVAGLEDEFYYNDYESDDEGKGDAFWQLSSDAAWLNLDNQTGELNGIPTNFDVGIYWVNVSINDSFGGLNWTNFSLSIIDINDPPVIITEDIVSINEDELYSVDYEAIDIDGDKVFEWYLDTNSSWLSIDKDSGILSGIPENADAGFWFVNVTVNDNRAGQASHNFTIEVLNVNDDPEWLDFPESPSVAEFDLFVYNVSAIDVDVGDELTYSIRSEPETNISINPITGQIRWFASFDEAQPDWNYILSVFVSVSDSTLTITDKFDLTIIPNYRPTVTLNYPEHLEKVSSLGYIMTCTYPMIFHR